MKNQLFLLLLAFISVGLSKEEKRKTLIIAVDEAKPEKSTAVISDLDLSLEGQSSAPVYRTSGRPYKPRVLQSSPIDKQLGYILLTPEDLNRLKNLEGVSVEEPKHVTLPHSLSEDNYEDGDSKERYPVRDEPKYLSGYSTSSAESPAPYHQPGYPPSPAESPAPYQPGYPPSPPSESYYSSPQKQKYPLRPAPPLSSLAASNISSYDPPRTPKYSYGHNQYEPYDPVDKDVGGPSSYSSGSPSSYSSGSPSSYGSGSPSSYGSGSPSSYGSGSPSSYGSGSPSSYGSGNPSSYSSGNPSSYSSGSPSSHSSGSSKSTPDDYPPPSSSYGSHRNKSPEGYSPEPYMYSGYKAPQTGGYPKHSSEPKPSPEYTPSHYKYPITPVDPSLHTKSLNSPSKYVPQDVPPHSYNEPSSAYYDSNKKPYLDPPPYENTYKGEHVPNNDIPSYGTRNKYIPESSPPSNTYSSKPHYTESIKYPPKETYTAPLNKYKAYNPKPYYSSPHDTSPKHKDYSDGSKSSYSDVTGPSYKDTIPPSSDGYYYPPSSSYSGRYPQKPHSPSHQTQIHSGKAPYTGKSPKVRVKVSENSGTSPYAYENKYPSKNTPVSSGGSEYISSPVSSKSHSSYHGPSSPKSAVVTSFYDNNPSSYPGKEVSYEGRYPEDETPHKYDTPLPSKYATEDSKPVKPGYYEDPTYEHPTKEKSYYNPSKGRAASHKARDSHSVAKNYKPSRPAPLYDQYEQPRHPPLPDEVKDSSEKDIPYNTYKHSKKDIPYETYKHSEKDIPYDDHKHHSGEIHEGRSKSPSTSYTPDSYGPASYEENRQSYHPSSKYSSPGDYSGPSSHEDEDPVVYTKTYTKTYTKPQSDSSTEAKYYGDHSSEDAYSTPNKYPASSSYSSKDKYPTADSYSSNNEYAPPAPYSSKSKYTSPDSYSTNSKYPPSDSYSTGSKYPSSDSYSSKYSEPDSYSSKSKYSPSDSYSSTDSKSKSYNSDPDPYTRPHSYSQSPASSEYTFEKPLDNGEKKFKYYTENSEEIPYDTQRPKRVEGVVYRTRKTYPKIQSPRRQKSYLPYKVYDPKYAPAFDHKIYENAPQQNVTKGPTKAAFKLKYKPVKKEKEAEYSDGSYEENGFANIPGEAGKDFPILKEVPYSHFSCENRAAGFYADVEHRCQVYYQCSDKGGIQSFLCPNGTVFNQETFVCEWWHNVDCDKSEKHYSKNDDLYKSTPPPNPQYLVPEKHYRSPSHGYSSDEYSDNYRGDGNERISKYEKPIRKRRKNHSTVTYTSK